MNPAFYVANVLRDVFFTDPALIPLIIKVKR